MFWEHYVFGTFSAAKEPPGESFVNSLLDKAEKMQKELQRTDVLDIVEILHKVGRLWEDPNYLPRVKALQKMPEVAGFSEDMVVLGLKELSRLLTAENLLAILDGELGSYRFMNSWNLKPDVSSYTRAFPLGVILHVSPGNVFLGAADSLVRGLLTKNVNVLKVSHGDPVFPLLFAQSIIDADSEGLISKSFAVITFRGNDSELESLFKSRCQGIVVWGGAKAVEAWQDKAPLGLRVVPYGPRMSFALITEKFLENTPIEQCAENLAKDVVMWEQRGCGSPQFLFLQVPENFSINSPSSTHYPQQFVDSLCNKLEEFSQTIPNASLTTDEKIEILRERELADFDKVLGKGGLWKPKARQGLKWTVIWRDAIERLGSPLNRSLVIFPFSDFSQIVQALTPYRDILQSVGLAALSKETEHIINMLAECKVQRVTALGRMHLSTHGAPHDGSYQLERLIRWVCLESTRKDVENSTIFSSVGSGAATVQQSVRKILNYAKENSPYYREKYAQFNTEDFASLPFLTGEDVRLNTPPQNTNLLSMPLEHAYIFASGGSTGSPKFSFYTHREWEDVISVLADIYRIVGINSSDTVANLFMAGNLYTSFIVANQALEKIGCVNLPIAGNALMDQVVLYIELFKPTAIVGLPSIIIQLAETIEKRGLNVCIKKILYGGEHLSKEASDYLRKVLGTEIVMSAGYASVDAGPVGYQCPHCPKNLHHLLDSQYLEVINPVTGLACAEGEVGELVVTSLGRKLMPLIRYRTGDLGKMVSQECPCGSSDPLFMLMGRTGDVLRVGTVSVYPDGIAKSLESVEGASHLFQIVAGSQGTKDTLTIKVERLNGDSGNLSKIIRQSIINDNYELDEALREGWLSSLTVEMMEPNTLPRLARTGKIKQAVDLRIH